MRTSEPTVFERGASGSFSELETGPTAFEWLGESESLNELL